MSRSAAVLFVHLDQFYIQNQARWNPQPTVIHREKLILDANKPAKQQGVQLGKGLAEAKTILGKDGVYIEWTEEVFRTAQSQWLDVCAEHADAIEPVDQHEAFIDLSDHPDPRDIQAHLIKELEARIGLPARTGLAPCRWIARVAALRGNPPEAFEDPEHFVAPLPVAAMPLPAASLTRLELLGCNAISDVAAMSIEALLRQFGQSAYDFQRLARGTGESRVNAVYPPDCVSGRFSFEGSAQDREVFDNGLKHLARKVGMALSEQEVFGEVLELWLENEDGSIDQRSRKFSKPMSSYGSLVFALRILCGAIEKPVSKIRIRIPNLKKTNRVQKTLDNLTANAAKQDAGKAALLNIRAAFGDGSIQLGSEIEQPRYKQVRKAWRVASGWNW